MSDEYQEIKGLQNLNRYFGVLTTYSVLERILSAIFQDAKERKLVSEADLKKKRNLDFKNCVKFLKKDCKIDLTMPSRRYNALSKLRIIRNTIAHEGGWVHDDTASQLQSYGFKKHMWIELEENYFFENKELVYQTCLKVGKEYEIFLQKRKLL